MSPPAGRSGGLFNPPEETLDQRCERVYREYVNRAAHEIVPGHIVRVHEGADAFEYGGSAPLGGIVEKVYGNGKVAVRFFSMDEEGDWSWATWTFTASDLEPVR